MIDFDAKLRELGVSASGEPAGTLKRRSQYEFAYAAAARRAVSLIMPREDVAFADGELFAVMDMNLPEGFLLARIRERAPKSPPTKMHLLLLAGTNGIGWLGYTRPGERRSTQPRPIDRKRLLRDGVRHGFDELVEAYLSTGAGLSGIQPKIMVPERAAIPVPNLIVKTAGSEYPHLASNEFLCLEVARRSGLDAAGHELSDDGELLVIDRFDLGARSQRLGFEDIAALLDLRVGGALSDRKYRGSYEDVARVIAKFSSQPDEDMAAFFRAVALSVLLRNGDAHLKNFALLYDDSRRWLAPIFDVVTTTMYAYERADGLKVTDRTMALKLRRGDRSRGYPLPEELLAFGSEVCRRPSPRRDLEPLFEAIPATLRAARRDERIPPKLLERIEPEWTESLQQWR